MFRYSVIFFLIVVISLPTNAQRLLTESEAVSKALIYNKNLQAASLQVKQQQQLLKSAFNIRNPDFFVESPTGNFYTSSITQSLDFPTVYTNQYRLQKQQIGVAEKEKILTEAELKYRIKVLYLEAQYSELVSSRLLIQDTLYEKIMMSAIRQFKAGQIDYLQQTFAETQYGEIHNQYKQSLIKAASIKAQLGWLIGIKDSISLEPMVIVQLQPQFVSTPDSVALLLNPAIQLFNQQEQVAKQNISLQKSKALPGLAFGYFNQGERSTILFNRFRVGLTIPLWFGQYKSNINAAKTSQQIIQSKQQGFQQELSVQSVNTTSEIQANWQSVQYYQHTGLRKAQEVITTSKRFFESGEIDYISFMRNSNDAYIIYLKNLEAIRNYNLSVINHKYLMGQL
ncbi:MAG: TolC family protein [Chitinophagaceae bacterium]|nr:TolC family protein [Chitinophagaceae bacterium]